MVEDDIKQVAKNFRIYGDFRSATPYGSGHINDTFAVIFNQSGTEVRYIFQRINGQLFKTPSLLMDNIRRVVEHLQGKLVNSEYASSHALRLIYTHKNQPYHIDSCSRCWRVYPFIEHATAHDIVVTPEQAYQAARSFGKFQADMLDFQGAKLYDTIEDFHNSEKRFTNLLESIYNDIAGRVTMVAAEVEFAITRKDMVGNLLELHRQGEIPERITHNDAKINNVMLDDRTGTGVCVIDLDTVMSGLALYDFGDLVRTSTSREPEDSVNYVNVNMRMEIFEALVRGYLSSAHFFLTECEVANLAFSGKLITFENGIRFLSDYLDGDIYFKTSRSDHNLDRCRTQFALVESIEAQEDEMEKVVQTLYRESIYLHTANGDV